MLQQLLDIFTAPTTAFARIQHKPTVFWPLLLLVVALASIQAGYLSLTDRAFLIDQFVEQAMASNASLNEEQLRPAYESMPMNVLMGTATVGTMVTVLVVCLLMALYLNFMSKFGHEGYTYKHWLSLVCWTSMPTLLIALAAWVAILSGNGRVDLMSLQPLSLDSLLGIDSGKPIMQNLSLPQFWAMALLVLGYRYLTKSTLLRASIITLAPYVLIFGIWGWFSFN
jgi:Yip1 domain.